MLFDHLNEDNFLLFAIKNYENPQAVTEADFDKDLNHFKYIKRLLKRYKNTGQLKERLLLNHFIIFFNVFPVEAGTRILFYKIEQHFWPMLKTFLIYLDRMPDKIESIRGQVILSSEIDLDEGIVKRLRSIKV